MRVPLTDEYRELANLYNLAVRWNEKFGIRIFFRSSPCWTLLNDHCHLFNRREAELWIAGYHARVQLAEKGN